MICDYNYIIVILKLYEYISDYEIIILFFKLRNY